MSSFVKRPGPHTEASRRALALATPSSTTAQLELIYSYIVTSDVPVSFVAKSQDKIISDSVKCVNVYSHCIFLTGLECVSFLGCTFLLQPAATCIVSLECMR